MQAWMQEQEYLQFQLTPSERVVTESRKAPVSTVTTLSEGVSLIKDKAGSNPAMRTWAHGGFAFPRLCQRPLSSDIHQMIRRLPVRAVVTGAYHSESGSSIKAIAKPMTIDEFTVDGNWCSVVYTHLTEYSSAVGSLSAASTRRQLHKKQPLGVVRSQGLRVGKLSKRPQAENSTGFRPIDDSTASPLGLGGILSPSPSQAY